jgi:O-succinylbenzoate synthase
MTITRACVYAYRLPLVRPITFLHRPIEFREGFLLRVEDDSGNIGYGECAPLAGYSRESLELAETELTRIARHLRHTEINDLDPLASAAEILEHATCSSVTFAVESAFATLVASQQRRPVATLFNEDFLMEVPVNALLESAETAPDAISRLSSCSCTAVKLKVGRQAIEEDIALVKSIRAQLPEHISLRLDANRLWTFDQAGRFAEGVDGLDIEYVEEPLRDPSELPRFALVYPEFPVALDESVRDLTADDIANIDWCRAVVLKPTVMGGIARTFEIIDACKVSRKKAVLGAAIESSVGLTMIANMAASTLDDTPIGLDTGRLLARDLVERRLKISNYRIVIDPDCPTTFALNTDLVHEVMLG